MRVRLWVSVSLPVRKSCGTVDRFLPRVGYHTPAPPTVLIALCSLTVSLSLPLLLSAHVGHRWHRVVDVLPQSELHYTSQSLALGFKSDSMIHTVAKQKAHPNIKSVIELLLDMWLHILKHS